MKKPRGFVVCLPCLMTPEASITFDGHTWGFQPRTVNGWRPVRWMEYPQWSYGMNYGLWNGNHFFHTYRRLKRDSREADSDLFVFRVWHQSLEKEWEVSRTRGLGPLFPQETSPVTESPGWQVGGWKNTEDHGIGGLVNIRKDERGLVMGLL